MDRRSITGKITLVTLGLFVLHVAISHFTGFDLSKSIIAIAIGAINFAYLYFNHKEIPDFKKELRDEFNVAIEGIKKEYDDKLAKQKVEIVHTMSSEFSKYQALLIKSPTRSLGVESNVESVLKNVQTQYRF